MKKYVYLSGRLLLLALLSGGFLLTYLAWRYAATDVQNIAQERFQGRVLQVKSAIRDRMLDYEHVLRGGVGLFNASGYVSRKEWHEYVSTLNINEYYPGIQGLGFAKHVRPAELPLHIAQVRREGFADYALRPIGEREEYTSIIYLEPFDARNRRAFGFDMFSEPTRRLAMERARDSGKTFISGRVKLVQETTENVQAGFLMYLPVYRGSPQNAAQRRAALLGYVYSPFRMNDLMQGVLGNAMPDVSLEIYDGMGIAADGLMYRSAAEQAGRAALFSDTSEIVVNGREWTLQFESLPQFDAGVDRLTPLVIAISGAVLTLLLSLLMWSLWNTRTRAVEMADEMTLALREREEHLRSVVDTAVDGILVIDEHGIIELCNHSSTRMFGYAADEMIGKNVSMLMPEPHRSQHDGYLERYLRTGEARIIGKGRELVGLRKDGSTFPMDLSVGEMHIGTQRKFTGMVHDVTERKRVDRLKNEFVSTVSHELRTPLTSIRGSLGLVAGGVAGAIPEQAKNLVDIAYKNSERLVRLINDILDIEKIESGKMDLHMKREDLMSLLNQSIEANRDYAAAFGVSYRLVQGMPGALVNVDHDRLMQVMSNLLSNAAKFSPANGQVEVAVSKGGLGVRVSVTDKGEGIPAAFQERIFQKFSQADSSDTRKKGGTGLGLNISRAIIEKMGGKIDFSSEPGTGTVFYFELPLFAEQNMVQPQTAPTAAPGVVLSGKQHRVLVCEDNEDVALLLSIMLKEGGFEADVAYTARQAKDLLKERQYDAMTLDIVLPDQDGISLLRELRAEQATCDLPVLIVSAYASQGRAEIDSSYELVGWHDKPIDRDYLITQLNEVMAARAGKSLPRILHVEDDADVRRVMSTIGHGLAEFDFAESVQEAKEKLASMHYDLLILDVGLPDGSGLQLLPQLGNLGPDIPVMIFSGQNVSESEKNRVASVLMKASTSNQTLLDTIKGLLQRSTEH